MPPVSASPEPLILGLHSLRFFCAVWVVIDHIGLVSRFFPFLSALGPLGWAVGKALNVTVNGPAAVIVFFVISGLCVHYPYRDKATVFLPGYFLRRYLRILLPLLVVEALVFRWNGFFNADYPLGAWSIYAELVYYTLYPALRDLARRWGWSSLIVTSFATSFGLVHLAHGNGNYPSFGHSLNWLLGLPCWLLGCQLAEKVGGLKSVVGRAEIWTWRLGVLGISVLTLLLRFHSDIGYPWTLNGFGLLAYFWLKKEIPYFRSHGAPAWMEAGGAWSYSLYITHGIVIDWSTKLPSIPWVPTVWTQLFLSLLFALVFYHLIEKPSHLFAKACAVRVRGRR